MKALLITGGVVVYFIIAGIVYEISSGGDGGGEDIDFAIAGAWPVSIPIIGVVMVAIAISQLGRWLVKGLKEWFTRPARVAKALK